MAYQSPKISFVDVDPKALAEEMVASYEDMAGRKLGAADPTRLAILWWANAVVQQDMKIDRVAKRNIPRYAQGEWMDLLCELFDRASRRQASTAETTMRFWLSEERPTGVIVPAGTRISAGAGVVDGKEVEIVFATEKELIIPRGNLYGDVSAVCRVTGTVGNGFKPGSITALVDVFGYYDHCENLTVSEGGAETETDAEFYEQMRQSMEGYSTAGPEGAYEYWAKSVNPSITDVKATSEVEQIRKTLQVYKKVTSSGSSGSGSTSGGSPGSEGSTETEGPVITGYAFFGGEQILEGTIRVFSPGTDTQAVNGTDYAITYEDGLVMIAIYKSGILEWNQTVDVDYQRERAGRVRVCVLLENGELPGRELLDDVSEALSASKIRPLTDVVTVTTPDVIRFDVDLTYYIPTDGTVSAEDMEAAVQEAVDGYIAWQSAKMGRDINPTELIYRVKKTGVKRVQVNAPLFSIIGKTEVALPGNRNIVNGGREDE